MDHYWYVSQHMIDDGDCRAKSLKSSKEDGDSGIIEASIIIGLPCQLSIIIHTQTQVVKAAPSALT